MDSDRHEDSGEMYSPDEQGEYMLLDGTPRFSMQGLSDALADVGERINGPPAEEYTMMLEVMMADHPGWPHPPVFSWNAGIVMHCVRSDTGNHRMWPLPRVHHFQCMTILGVPGWAHIEKRPSP